VGAITRRSLALYELAAAGAPLAKSGFERAFSRSFQMISGLWAAIKASSSFSFSMRINSVIFTVSIEKPVFVELRTVPTARSRTENGFTTKRMLPRRRTTSSGPVDQEVGVPPGSITASWKWDTLEFRSMEQTEPGSVWSRGQITSSSIATPPTQSKVTHPSKVGGPATANNRWSGVPRVFLRAKLPLGFISTSLPFDGLGAELNYR